MDGDFVEPPQSLWLRYAVLDHHGVEIFHSSSIASILDYQSYGICRINPL